MTWVEVHISPLCVKSDFHRTSVRFFLIRIHSQRSRTPTGNTKPPRSGCPLRGGSALLVSAGPVRKPSIPRSDLRSYPCLTVGLGLRISRTSIVASYLTTCDAGSNVRITASDWRPRRKLSFEVLFRPPNASGSYTDGSHLPIRKFLKFCNATADSRFSPVYPRRSDPTETE